MMIVIELLILSMPKMLDKIDFDKELSHWCCNGVVWEWIWTTWFLQTTTPPIATCKQQSCWLCLLLLVARLCSRTTPLWEMFRAILDLAFLTKKVSVWSVLSWMIFQLEIKLIKSPNRWERTRRRCDAWWPPGEAISIYLFLRWLLWFRRLLMVCQR